MGKFLRVLLIILMLLSGVALTFGIMLFSRREMLKGRTQKLENALLQLASTIEDKEPVSGQEARYPERDISPCTDEVLDNPERKEYWRRYALELEQLDIAPINLNDRQRDLMTYYQVNPIDGSVVQDGITGLPSTTGAGTMQNLIDEIVKKATGQYSRLNKTRQQLKELREELIDTINELNKKKHEHRLSLKEITEYKNEIARLKGEIEALKARVQELEEEKQALQDRLTDAQNQINEKDEKIQEKEDEVRQLKKEITTLREQGGGGGMSGGAMPTAPQPGQADVTAQSVPGGIVPEGMAVVLPPGQARPVVPGLKGKVASVNEAWKFVVVEFSDEFMQELLGDDLSGPVPRMEFIVIRPGEPEKFVTKLSLLQIKKDQKLGIADILINWQQLPVQPGDIIRFER
ncbi:MAG: hypothetical protein A2340_07010 [Lentisphaerae bacterium RIFOXYB12_FULL_60_10]|nr:MAG: hypothetical protein A2340_07010 [Lentisphaerae bacterium RIFOXYB12_FULL_60_10]